jgi:hypothetical protein
MCANDIRNHISVISYKKLPHMAGDDKLLNTPKAKNKGAGASERIGYRIFSIDYYVAQMGPAG